MSAEIVVSVHEMIRRYGGVVAVDGISFDVLRGEMFGLIGPDGAGKTTTLRVILGLLAPNSGVVRACGLDPVRQAGALSRRVGYLSQRFSLYGDLTVDENIEFFAQIHGVRGWRPRRDELLELLRMAPFRSRLGDRLSGGMKQKLALACTLIHTPELLILDEPTTGVDPVSRRDFWKILAQLQSSGLTVLLTTPYLDEAERCQRVALINGGRILAIDTPAAVRASDKRAMIELIADPKRLASEVLASLGEVTSFETFGERLHVTLASGVDPSGATAAIARKLGERGVRVSSARAIAPSLEDIFIARMGSSGETGTEMWS